MIGGHCKLIEAVNEIENNVRIDYYSVIGFIDRVITDYETCLSTNQLKRPVRIFVNTVIAGFADARTR